MTITSLLPTSFRGSGVAPGSSNREAGEMPFQRWYNFKEAFAPEFVAEIIGSMPGKPARCLDPFGGSGTTALTCQFLGMHASTIEVNPFLADLTEAKLSAYDVDSLVTDRCVLADRCAVAELVLDSRQPAFPGAPATFVEPGLDERWIFDRDVAARIVAYRHAIEDVESETNRRLFRVLLGSVLIPVSNVTISGKGRRYRSNWQARRRCANDVDRLFEEAFQRALYDICRYGDRRTGTYTLLRGDCRSRLADAGETDLVLFSPPYPNSFDYTDIYNVELWALGYLETTAANRSLREATLRSHVQIKRDFGGAGLQSPTLARTLDQLNARTDELWNANIPAMVAAYFRDLQTVMERSRRLMNEAGRLVMVVGDSRYAEILIDVPAVVAELAPSAGFRCEESIAVRSMRSSPQHGGGFSLGESLVRLAPA
jgi:hypothetical protein